MAPSRRQVMATAEETVTPPDELLAGQTIARVQKALGNNLYRVIDSSDKEYVVEMQAKFRSTIWLKRGGFVLIDTELQPRENKIQGDIVNVVRDSKTWQKQAYWPAEFRRRDHNDDMEVTLSIEEP